NDVVSQLDGLLDSGGHLLQGEVQLDSQVGSAPPRAAPPSATSQDPLEDGALENLVEVAEDVLDIPELWFRPAGSQSLVAVAIVELFPLRITQDLKGLRDFLELGFRRWIAGVLVRVVLERQLAVGLLDLFGRCVSGDPQGLIVIRL